MELLVLVGLIVLVHIDFMISRMEKRDREARKVTADVKD